MAIQTTIFQRDVLYFKNFGTINLESYSWKAKLYVGLIFVGVCMQLLSCLTDTYLVFGDIDLMVQNMAISLTFVYGVFKFGVIFYIQPQIIRLIESFEQLQHQKVLFATHKYEPSLMGRIASQFDKYARYYVRFVFFVAGTWYFQPIIQLKRILPFPGTRYPYPLDTWPTYLATYALQVCSNLYLLLYVAAIDLFVLKTIVHTCEHLHQLGHSLSHSLKGSKLSHQPDSTADYERLVQCIRYQKAMYSICQVLKDCLSWVLMSQFTYNLTTLCFAIMALAKAEKLDASVLNLITYFTLANVEIFVFCWFSHQLSDYSEALSDCAYFSHWELCPSKIRHALRFIMFVSRQPVQLLAGGIFPVSVVSYVSIVRTSFSYYTLLKQLNGEQDK